MENQTNTKPIMLGIKPTAEKYGLTQRFVRSLLLSGKVRGVRIGRGKLLCNCNDLEHFIYESYVNSPADADPSGVQPIPVKF